MVGVGRLRERSLVAQVVAFGLVVVVSQTLAHLFMNGVPTRGGEVAAVTAGVAVGAVVATTLYASLAVLRGLKRP